MSAFTEVEKMCLSQKMPKKISNKDNKEDQKYLLRLMMNDMKKNLDFIDKTNWMFTQENFDIHFLNK